MDFTDSKEILHHVTQRTYFIMSQMHFLFFTLDHSAHSRLVFDSNGGGAVAGPG